MPSIVKHSYLKSGPGAVGRARAHVSYIHFRSRPDRMPGKTAFFDAGNDKVCGRTVQDTIRNAPNRGVLIHKFILSPGSNDIDAQEYTRNIMEQLSHSTGFDLQWYAREHTNTDNAHAHVIVMGIDRQGRSVRFDRTDHDLMRKSGDRYIEAHERFYRELEQDLERAVSVARSNEPTHRETAEKLVAKVDTALKRLFRREPNKEAQWLRRRRENPYQRRRRWYQGRWDKERREKESLGSPWSETRHRTEQPAKIVWRRPGPPNCSSRVEITANSPLPALLELSHAVLSGACTLSHKDTALLVSWMEEKNRQDIELDRKARAIRLIEVTTGTDQLRTFVPDDHRDELRALWDAHRAGRVVLKEEEERALSWWLSRKEHPRDRSR